MHDASELPQGAQDYVEKVAAPYFAAYTRWLEEIHVGMTGGEMFDKVEEILPRATYGWSLCPGHLVAEEEWLCSPIYEHSAEVLLQRHDAADRYHSLGAGLRRQLCREHRGAGRRDPEGADLPAVPEMWQRMQVRRQYIIQQLGIQLSEDVLPMCGTVAYLRPYLLEKDMAFVSR